jgi:hypothetical protein
VLRKPESTGTQVRAKLAQLQVLRGAGDHTGVGNVRLRVPPDALHEAGWLTPESGHPILAAGAITVAALVVLAGPATVPVADLNRPGTGPARCRALLDRISRKQDGTAAAANTANRKRAVLSNLMQYAVETDALPANPLKAVTWTRPRTLKTVDPRTVVNSDQARRLLTAVGQQGERGARMVAFFGCMYYAALRPEEAVELRPDNLASLPDHGWG